jgi:anti-sigma regulatory factor (Ser/Thr protein kinase)
MEEEKCLSFYGEIVIHTASATNTLLVDVGLCAVTSHCPVVGDASESTICRPAFTPKPPPLRIDPVGHGTVCVVPVAPGGTLAAGPPVLVEVNVTAPWAIDVTIRNAKRLQRLTEDILDVTKIETKTLDLKKEPFIINELIINAITDYTNLIAKENKGSNLLLQLVDSEEHILIEADKGRINQVISNLLSNAIKFTNNGSISVAVGKKGKREKEYEERYNEEVIVSIKDTGTGIDPAILPRLFTKFATKSTAAGGTGLGLFISKSIVEAHGGRIWAENNRELSKGDNGATFYFTLPILTTSAVNDNQMRVRSLHQLWQLCKTIRKKF